MWCFFFSQGSLGDREAMVRLGNNILAVSPILEAFGNAATVRFSIL